MTATEPSVRETAGRVWSLIADHRAHREPNEPGLPPYIALEMMTDTRCERETAFAALRAAAADVLALHGANLPGRIVGNPHTWGSCARMMLHMIGADSANPEIVAGQLRRAEAYREHLIREQMRRGNLDHQQWRERADWLTWAADARLAILWLTELLAESRK